MTRKLFITFFIFNALFSYGIHLKKDSVGIAKINGRLHIRYMVSPGETIYRISTKYKVPISDLIDTNPELEFGLKTGQVISIPINYPDLGYKSIENLTAKPEKVKSTEKQPKTTPDSATENIIVHTVLPGETYNSLSQKYGLPVDELLKFNNVELISGQKIKVNLKSIKQGANNKPAPVEKEKEILNFGREEANNENELTKNLVPENYENVKKHLLVIPFDPYLYFSDADDEISATSKIQRTKVRQAFRRRLSALLDPQGYETINLLGGKAKDSLTDLNKIYSSVTYSYQEILNSPYNIRMEKQPEKVLGKNKSPKPGEKLTDAPSQNSRASQAKDPGKYFGVRINNKDFFTYFNNKYKIDYYLFINQFEVKTNYENCLDRATLNYERGFITHFSIFDKEGRQVAGNRIYTDYNSNTNNIAKILADNMQKVADIIIAELPSAK